MRFLAARAQRVDEVGDDFLAGAAFAGDEHGHVAGRDAFDGADDRLHRGALENRRGTAAHGGKGAAQGIVLLLLLPVFNRAVNRDEQRLRVERLVDEMKRAALGRLHGGLEGGLAGQHDDFRVRPGFFDLRQQVQAVGVRQFQVEQHHVRRVLAKNIFAAPPRSRLRSTVISSSRMALSMARKSASSSTIKILPFMVFMGFRRTPPQISQKSPGNAHASAPAVPDETARSTKTAFSAAGSGFNSIASTNPVAAAGRGHERFRRLLHRLMMRAVHAQNPLALQILDTNEPGVNAASCTNSTAWSSRRWFNAPGTCCRMSAISWPPKAIFSI